MIVDPVRILDDWPLVADDVRVLSPMHSIAQVQAVGLVWRSLPKDAYRDMNLEFYLRTIDDRNVFFFQTMICYGAKAGMRYLDREVSTLAQLVERRATTYGNRAWTHTQEFNAEVLIAHEAWAHATQFMKSLGYHYLEFDELYDAAGELT